MQQDIKRPLELPKEVSTKQIVETNPDAVLPPPTPAKQAQNVLADLKNNPIGMADGMAKTLSGLVMGQRPEDLKGTDPSKLGNALTGLAVGSALVAGAAAIIKEYNSPEAIARRQAAAEAKQKEEEKREEIAEQDKQKQEQLAKQQQELRKELQDKVNLDRPEIVRLDKNSAGDTLAKTELKNAIALNAEKVKQKLEEARGSLKDPEEQKEKDREEGKLTLDA
jgi:hypothetical protein